jgi:hypothetical protein
MNNAPYEWGSTTKKSEAEEKLKEIQDNSSYQYELCKEGDYWYIRKIGIGRY